MSLNLSLSQGNNITPIDEDQLYNPGGIAISYGYDGKAVYGDEENAAYSAIAQTPGLHSIKLSRALVSGEKIRLHWRNNCDLIIFCENDGKTRIKKTIGGTYQEIGKNLPIEYLYYEILNPVKEELYAYYEYNGTSYVKTQDTTVVQGKKYYSRISKTSENTCPRFDDDILTKRFDCIETKILREF